VSPRAVRPREPTTWRSGQALQPVGRLGRCSPPHVSADGGSTLTVSWPGPDRRRRV